MQYIQHYNILQWCLNGWLFTNTRKYYYYQCTAAKGTMPWLCQRRLIFFPRLSGTYSFLSFDPSFGNCDALKYTYLTILIVQLQLLSKKGKQFFFFFPNFAYKSNCWLSLECLVYNLWRSLVYMDNQNLYSRMFVILFTLCKMFHPLFPSHDLKPH